MWPSAKHLCNKASHSAGRPEMTGVYSILELIRHTILRFCVNIYTTIQIFGENYYFYSAMMHYIDKKGTERHLKS